MCCCWYRFTVTVTDMGPTDFLFCCPSWLCCVCGSPCWLWCALFICFFCHGHCQCQLLLFPFAHHWTTSQPLRGPTTACLNTVKSALHVRFFARLLGRQYLAADSASWNVGAIVVTWVFSSPEHALSVPSVSSSDSSASWNFASLSAVAVSRCEGFRFAVSFSWWAVCVFSTVWSQAGGVSVLCPPPPPPPPFWHLCCRVLLASGVGCALSVRGLPSDCRKAGGPKTGGSLSATEGIVSGVPAPRVFPLSLCCFPWWLVSPSLCAATGVRFLEFLAGTSSDGKALGRRS